MGVGGGSCKLMWGVHEWEVIVREYIVRAGGEAHVCFFFHGALSISDYVMVVKVKEEKDRAVSGFVAQGCEFVGASCAGYVLACGRSRELRKVLADSAGQGRETGRDRVGRYIV